MIPVTWCLRAFKMVFVLNRRFSFFSNWLIMERSQNWLYLMSPISKFWDRHLAGTCTYIPINRWKFQGNHSVGVALTSIQTFYEVMSLDVSWWPDLAWSGSEIFTTYAKNMYDKVCQKRRAQRRHFLAIWKKPEGLSRAPHIRAKVNQSERTIM